MAAKWQGLSVTNSHGGACRNADIMTIASLKDALSGIELNFTKHTQIESF